MKSLSRVQPLVTPWTAAYQAPPSMGFSRQEYWSGLPLGLVSQIYNQLYFFFFFFLNFGCTGSSLLHVGFLKLWWAGVTLCCSCQACHCSGFSCCRALALDCVDSGVVAHSLSCSTAHGIFQAQGSLLCPLNCQADLSHLDHQRSPNKILQLNKKTNIQFKNEQRRKRRLGMS